MLTRACLTSSSLRSQAGLKLKFQKISLLLAQAQAGTPHALAKPALTILDALDARFDRWWPDYKPWCVRHLASQGDGGGSLTDGASSSGGSDDGSSAGMAEGGCETAGSDRGVDDGAVTEHVGSDSSDDGSSSSSDSDADG